MMVAGSHAVFILRRQGYKTCIKSCSYEKIKLPFTIVFRVMLYMKSELALSHPLFIGMFACISVRKLMRVSWVSDRYRFQDQNEIQS